MDRQHELCTLPSREMTILRALLLGNAMVNNMQAQVGHRNSDKSDLDLLNKLIITIICTGG